MFAIDLPSRAAQALRAAFAAAVVVACLSFATAEASAAGDGSWITRFGMTAAQYQAEFDRNAREGYRLTSVSGYDQFGTERYSAVWEKRDGPIWEARHGLSGAQYQSTFKHLTDHGYRPVLVNAHNTIEGKPRFAAIFERDSSVPWVARHGLTPARYQEEFDRLAGQGYRLTHVSGYTSGGAARYAAIWEQRPGPAWRAVHGQTSAQYQATFNRLTAQGYRPVKVSGYDVDGTPRYAAIFEAGADRPWVARHGLDSPTYQATVTDLRYQGYRPVHVNAFGSERGPRFSAIWENHAFSGADLNHIDTTVANAMKARNVSGLSLAISRRGRLVFAKSYGYADLANKTPLRTTHRMRIASLTKPFTAAEIMRLVEAGRLQLSDRVFGRNGLLGETYGAESTYKDPRVKDITVQHLLEHTAGGWDNRPEDGTDDPMFIELSRSRDDLIRWVLQNVALEYAPGERHQYSNVGYAILGRIIERVTGKTYASAMRDDIFAPSGAGSFAIGGDTLGQRLPEEAIYDHDGARTAPYAQKVARMDAHGGWVATPVDVVRAALRIDGFATVPDLLGGGALTTMTTPTTAPNPAGQAVRYAKGWDKNASGLNWFHTGELKGTTGVLVRTTDEFVWSAVTNSRNSAETPDEATDRLDTLMWDVVNGVKAWPDHDLFE